MGITATIALAFGAGHFRRLRRLFLARTGIALDDNKLALVMSLLGARVRDQFDGSFDRYCALLEGGDLQEEKWFIDALTTHLTSFFRESHHFDFLRSTFTDVWSRPETREIRIWSAGCSSGEEPYSIALTLAEKPGLLATHKVAILATDIAERTLQIGERGIYPEERCRDLPADLAQRYFLWGTGSNQGNLQVKPSIRALVRFEPRNLVSAWRAEPPFHGIFCRNTLIYFSEATRREVLSRLVDRLVVGGYLFLGHAETLFQSGEQLQLVGNTTYRRAR